MVVNNVNSNEEFFRLLNNPMYKYSLVNYTAKWCGPCNAIKPFVEELSRVFPHVQFIKVDVDEQPEISNWALVRGLPTFTVYKSVNKLYEMVGADRNSLRDMLSKLI